MIVMILTTIGPIITESSSASMLTVQHGALNNYFYFHDCAAGIAYFVQQSVLRQVSLSQI